MKKLSKILAMILTVCLLAGIVAVVASATAPADHTTNTVNGKTFNYTFDSDADGTNYNGSFTTGTGDADKCSAVKVVSGVDGNKYVSYSYVKDAVNKAYRRDFAYGVKSKTFLNDYSYVTVDFDITADKYMVMVGYKIKTASGTNTCTYTVQSDWMLIDDSTTEASIVEQIAASNTAFEEKLEAVITELKDGVEGVTVSSSANGIYPAITADTVAADYIGALEAVDYAKAISTKRLAYSNGAYFSTDNRAQNDSGTVGGGYAKFYVYFVYDEEAKVWNACADSSGDTVLAQLSNELGAWNHFTYAFKAVETVVTEADGDTPAVTTMGESLAQLFINGEAVLPRDYLVNTYTKAGNFVRTNMPKIDLRAFDFQIVQYATVYSMGLDNIVSTYYDKDYSSGDEVYGIDDLFDEETDTTPLYACEDVVFDSYYEYPAPSNVKSVSINDGAKIYTAKAAVYELASVKGGTVNTSLDLIGVTPMKGADITVTCEDSINVTLSKAGAETHSIEKTETGYAIRSNQLVLPTVGSGEDLVFGNYIYTDFESGQNYSNWTGSHGFNPTSSSSYLRIGANSVAINPYNGNKYLAIRRNNANNAANNTTNAYVEYSLSDWTNNASSRYKGNILGRYDYVTLDFDFGTDAYQLHVGYRVVRYTPSSGDAYKTIEKAYRTYTPDELTREAVEADIASVREALLADTVTYAADLNAADIAKYTAIEMSYDSAIATKTLAYVHGANFYMGIRNYNAAGQTATSNETNSFLYTACVDSVWGLYKASTYTAANFVCELPENPYDLVHITYVIAVDQDTSAVTVRWYVDGKLVDSKSNTAVQVAKCLDSLRLQMPKDYKDEDAYSYSFDNVTVNYYEVGYSSGDAYGIDDYVKAADFTAPIYDCTDIVYNRGYVSPNGFVQVDEGEKSYITPIINEALAEVQDASTIYTSKQIYNFTPDPSVEILSVHTENGGMIHLSVEAAKRYFVEQDDENLYTIRVASEEDAIILEWYNSDDVLIKTELLLPNVEADASLVDASIYNIETREYTYVTSWLWDLDGDFDYEPIGSFGIEDGIGGNVVKVIPVTESEYLGETYAIYYTDEVGVTKLHGTVADYYADENLATLVSEAPDNSTVIIYEDILRVNYKTITIPAGKTINVNLNGKMIYHSGTSNTGDWGTPLFAVSEGSTFNLYSSVAGAEIYQARWRKDSGIYTGYPAVVSTVANADNLVINVGKYADYSGDNLSIYSGTIFSQVATSITSESAPLSDSERVVFNIDGGYYYEFIDTSYALIKIATPDVDMNIKNASFYCVKGAILWSDDRYHCENARVFFYDCDIYAESNLGAMSAFISRFHGEGSVIYLEGNKIFGTVGNFAKNNLYVGPDNEITWNLKQSTNYSYLVYASYVDGEFVKDVTYANVNNDAYVINFNDFAIPTFTPDAENNNYLADESFGSAAPIERSSVATLITFKTDAVPANVRNVTWMDIDGSEISSCYWVVGSLATAPAHSGKDVTKDYFIRTYSWKNVNGVDTSFTVSDTLENIFSATVNYTVNKIGGMKANMDLLTNLSFNLYLPISDEISDLTIVDENGYPVSFAEADVLGTAMYKLSWQQLINDFDAKEITVKYTVDGVQLSAKVSLDPIKYASIVASTFECGSEEAILAYEIINYKAAVATYLDPGFTSAVYDEFLAVFSSHENCGCASTEVAISEEEIAVDYSNLDIQWVQYALSIERIGMIIKADPASVVSVSYKGADGNNVDLEVEYDETNEYFIVSAVKAAYIDDIMYITVNGETGTYCLGKFIENTGVDVAKAIYTYAVAAENYKHLTASDRAE